VATVTREKHFRAADDVGITPVPAADVAVLPGEIVLGIGEGAPTVV